MNECRDIAYTRVTDAEIILLPWFTVHLSRFMTKPTKWHMRPAKTQISLDIRPVWSESSLSAWRKLVSLATNWAHNEDWSDWADAQADLSLRWAHSHFCWFCHKAAHLITVLSCWFPHYVAQHCRLKWEYFWKSACYFVRYHISGVRIWFCFAYLLRRVFKWLYLHSTYKSSFGLRHSS